MRPLTPVQAAAPGVVDVDGDDPLPPPPFPESAQILIVPKTQHQNRRRDWAREGSGVPEEGDQNGKQPQSSPPISASAAALRDLPPIHIAHEYWSYVTLDPSTHIAPFLHEDFSVARLERIYDILWWAGRQVPARPLHRHRFLGREIAIAEQADLHLVWSPEKVFIKPLPAYLLSHSFWATHVCPDRQLHASLCGFVLSYLWLVRYPSDFRIAIDEGLLPKSLTWDEWKIFAAAFGAAIGIDRPHSITKRYHYGELRLSRLDQIYRFAPRFMLEHVVYGYLYAYSSYGGFFKRKFAWIIVVFAYASIILSAMQVGLATPQLNENDDFNRASYGFSVVSILLPVIATAIALIMYLALFCFHLTVTLKAYFRERHRFSKP